MLYAARIVRAGNAWFMVLAQRDKQWIILISQMLLVGGSPSRLPHPNRKQRPRQLLLCRPHRRLRHPRRLHRLRPLLEAVFLLVSQEKCCKAPQPMCNAWS